MRYIVHALLQHRPLIKWNEPRVRIPADAHTDLASLTPRVLSSHGLAMVAAGVKICRRRVREMDLSKARLRGESVPEQFYECLLPIVSTKCVS